MNRTVAHITGDEVGELMEVDFEEDDLAAGRFLRIKLKMDIRKPLRWGIMVGVGDGEAERWCPIKYEFLPNFCYVCGLIGHTDRAFSKLSKDERVEVYTSKEKIWRG